MTYQFSVKGRKFMWWLAIAVPFILYLLIQEAIEKSKLTELMENNNKILLEIKELLKNQSENT